MATEKISSVVEKAIIIFCKNLISEGSLWFREAPINKYLKLINKIEINNSKRRAPFESKLTIRNCPLPAKLVMLIKVVLIKDILIFLQTRPKAIAVEKYPKKIGKPSRKPSFFVKLLHMGI